jgi:hypothetical protein
MTIIAVVRTASAVVLAADSKLTTIGIGGRDTDGKPILLKQTFDNAIKVATDETHSAIAAFAGHGMIGNEVVTEYFAGQQLGSFRREPAAQDEAIRGLIGEMVEARRAVFEPAGVFDSAPETTIILAAPGVGQPPRVWQVTLKGSSFEMLEILQHGGVWLAGTCDIAIPLLYGFGLFGEAMNALWAASGAKPEEMSKGIGAGQLHSPVRRINFAPMPIQDAIDFAAFCAKAQVDMERFLPGIPACGGPIDIMTLETSPEVLIRSFPGKTLRHPYARI